MDHSRDRLEHNNIVDEVKTSFLEYSMSVIVSRALPDLRDGLKPVHRRILYSMYESGYTPDKPHKKSARIVGDVMGDLNKRRGRVLGMDHIPGGKQTVTADVPMAEMFGYGTTLRAMTGGMGDFSYEFARYEQAPADVQRKGVEAAEKE